MNTILTRLDFREALAFRKQGWWGDQTIYDRVAAHAAKRPQAIAMRDRFRRVAYCELVAAADRLAEDLRRNGLRAGWRVAVWLPSRIETAVAMLACSRNGYICCPSLHRDHTVSETAELIKRIRASALIAEIGYGADGDRNDIFAATAPLELLRVAHRLEPLDERGAGGTVWPAGSPFAAPRGPAPKDDPDAVVYLAFTSGTTGTPKGVMHSDNTLLANALALAKDWRLGEDAIVYSLSPLSHNLGFGALAMTLSVGGEFVVHDLPRGQSLVDRIASVEATFLIGVPTHAIDLLAELKNRDFAALGRVRGFRISGASAAPSVVAGLIERGVIPQSGYGMTEAGSHHYTLPDDDPKLVCETSGRACAGYEIAIFSQEDPNQQLPAGEIGQIGGRGASLMLGYFDDQEATESAFNESGWFMTGDIGWVDRDGYLRVTGRKKDIIIRGGHNIYPAKVESLALRREGVDRAALVPVADERLGEKACLVVTTRDGAHIDAETMLEHLDACGLSKFDMPEYFLSLERMPLTTSGKILKRDLAAGIAEGRLRPQPVRFRPKTDG